MCLLNNVLSTDSANITLNADAASLVFASAAAGSQAVTVSGYAITGSASGNYSLSQPTGITGIINTKDVTISNLTAQSKPYDGTLAATFNAGYTINGVITADVNNVTATGAFTTADAGTNKTVNVALNGSASGNYNLTSPATLSANITKIAPQYTTSPITLGINGVYQLSTTNIVSTSNGTRVYSISPAGIATVNNTALTLTGNALGNATLTLTQAEGTNHNAGSTTIQVNVVQGSYNQNDFLSKTGTGSYTASSSWCKCLTANCTGTIPNQGGWGALSASSTPGSGATIYIQGILSGASTGAANVTILSGGDLSITGNYPVSTSITVKAGGKLRVNYGGVFTPAFDAPFVIEDSGSVYLNVASSSSLNSQIWNGEENFYPNSNFYINNIRTGNSSAKQYLVNGNITPRTHNGYTAIFGNVYIDPQITPTDGTETTAYNNTGFGGEDWEMIGPNNGTSLNLTHGDLIFLKTPYNVSDQCSCGTLDPGTRTPRIWNGTGTMEVNIKGNLRLEPTYVGTVLVSTKTNFTLNVLGNVVLNSPGTLTVRSNTNTDGNTSLNISGSLLINGSNTTTATRLILHQNTNNNAATGRKAIINLYGDLRVGTSPVILSSSPAADSEINFVGTAVQNLDIATTASTKNNRINFNIKNNAVVKLSRDLELGSNTTINVPSYGAFNVETGGTLNIDAYKISGIGAFNASTGANIITANTSGLNTAISPTGSTRIFNAGTNYVFNAATETPFPTEAQINNTNFGAPANVTTNANVTLNRSFSAISGNVTVAQDVTFNLDAFTLNRTAPAAGTFTIGNNATLKIGGTNTFPANYATLAFAPITSTVEYAGNQTVANLYGGTAYVNVALSGAGAKTLQNGLVVGNNLTLKSGSSVTIPAGTTITVKNKVINEAGADKFVVSNNAALLQDAATTTNSNATAITVIRNANALYKLDYTLWGSPVAGQELKAFSPATMANRFYTYAYNWSTSQNTSVEAYFPEVNTNNFTPGKAYLIRMPDAITEAQAVAPTTVAGYTAVTDKYTHVGSFAGTPNNGNVTVPVGFTNLQGGAAVNQNGHYIGVGNPYASPISVADFFLANSDVLEAGNGLYFWRKKNNAAANSYAHLTMMAYTANNALGGGDVGNNAGYYPSPVGTAFNPDWIISPGQGFLVKLKATLNTTDAVKFTNSMRRAAPVSGGQPFFRTLNTNDEAPLSRLWINLSGAADAFSQAAIGYMEGATLDLDYGYDGRILGDGTAKLYSKAAASNLAIQARPAFTATDIVPMGFAVTAPGQYTLSLDHMDGLFSGSQEVYLKDNLTGTTTSIKQNGYSFITEAGTFDGRFEVVYMQGQLGTQTPDLANMVMVYQQNGAIMINSGTAEMTGVTLYDIRGRKLYQKDNINATEASVSGLNIANQMVIVEISTVNGKVSKKIIY